MRTVSSCYRNNGKEVHLFGCRYGHQKCGLPPLTRPPAPKGQGSTVGDKIIERLDRYLETLKRGER